MAIANADVVLTLVTEPVMHATVERLNPETRSLQEHYVLGREPRPTAYEAMVEEILAHVRRGLDVCAAFYGHPGVFVAPSHEAVRRAREEGFRARMLPGVSAEDCLFADLGVDPARFGCQSYEATDFLVHGSRVDPTATLVLWQIGTVGNAAAAAEAQAERTGRPGRGACSSSTRRTTRSSSTRPRPYPGFDPLDPRGAAGRARAGARRRRCRRSTSRRASPRGSTSRWWTGSAFRDRDVAGARGPIASSARAALRRHDVSLRLEEP